MTGAVASSQSSPSDEDKPFSVSNLGDSASLKRCVDEAAAAAIIEQGYPEDFFHSNIRTGLGLIACSFAFAAQFWPATFPSNSTLLVSCVVGYIAFSVILNWHSMTFEGDVILFTKPKEGSPTSTGLAVATLLKRYSDEFTITIRPKDVKVPRQGCEHTYSVCRWFDVNGIMAREIIEADVLKLLHAHESAELKSTKRE